MKNNEKRKNDKLFDEIMRYLINTTDVDMLAQSQSTSNEVSGINLQPIKFDNLYMDVVCEPYLKDIYDSRQNVVVSNEGFRAGKVGLIDGGNYWTAKSQMIYKRTSAASISLSGNESLIFGYVMPSELFNNAQNVWNSSGSLPVVLYYATSASMNNTGTGGVSFGGKVSSGDDEYHMYKFDRSSYTWSTLLNTGVAVSYASGISLVNNCGVVCGGTDLGTPRSVFRNAYIVNTSEIPDYIFTATSDMSFGRWVAASLTINSDQGDVFGGRGEDNANTVTGECFTRSTSVWSQESSISTFNHRSTFGMASMSFSSTFGLVSSGSANHSQYLNNRSSRYCRPLGVWSEMMSALYTRTCSMGASQTPKNGILAGGSVFEGGSSQSIDFVEQYTNGYDASLNKFSINTLYLKPDAGAQLPPDKEVYVETTILNNIMNLDMMRALVNQSTSNVFASTVVFKDSKTPDPTVDVSLSGGQSWSTGYKVGEIIYTSNLDSYDVPEYNQSVIDIFDSHSYGNISDWVLHPDRGTIIYCSIVHTTMYELRLVEFVPGNRTPIRSRTVYTQNDPIDYNATITYSPKTNRFIVATYRTNLNMIFILEFDVTTYEIINTAYIYGVSADRKPHSAICTGTYNTRDYFLYTKRTIAGQSLYAFNSEFISSSEYAVYTYNNGVQMQSDNELHYCRATNKLLVHTYIGPGENNIVYINSQTGTKTEALLDDSCCKIQYIEDLHKMIRINNNLTSITVIVSDVDTPDVIQASETFADYNINVDYPVVISFSKTINCLYICFVDALSASSHIITCSIEGKLIDDFSFPIDKNVIKNMINSMRYDCFPALTDIYLINYINDIGKLYELKLRFKLFTSPEASNIWTLLPTRSSMFRARGKSPFAICTITKNKIFVTGGQAPDDVQSVCSEIFDNNTTTWTQYPAPDLLPVDGVGSQYTRSCYGYSTIDNFAVVCGNYQANGDKMIPQLYNNLTRSWTIKTSLSSTPPIFVGSAAFSMCNLSDVMDSTSSVTYESIDCYICGGTDINQEHVLGDVYKYSLYYDVWTHMNSVVESGATQKKYASATANTADVAFMSGGLDITDHECKFIQSSNTWKTIPGMNIKRYGHVSSSITSDVYFTTSGLDSVTNLPTYTETEAYLNSTNIWMSKIRASLSADNRRALSGMARLNIGELLLCGGSVGVFTSETINLTSNVFRYTDGQTEFLGFAATDFKGANLNDK